MEEYSDTFVEMEGGYHMSEQEKKNLTNEEMEKVAGGGEPELIEKLSEDLAALGERQQGGTNTCCTNPRAAVAVRIPKPDRLTSSCCTGGIKQRIKVKC